MTSLGAEPILDSYVAVALVTAGLALLLFAVRPQFGTLNRRRWLALTGIRLVIILLVMVALLRPTRITTLKTPRTSVLVMLLDVSRSMTLPSGRGGTSRWDIQKQTLARSQAALAQLAGKMELRVYGYDSQLHPLQITAGKLAIPTRPEGEQTDIGTTLSEALRAEQGKRLAGVILMGDGAPTAFEPAVETQEAGRSLRDNFAAPLYTITYGPAGDAAQSRDVAVERLDEQFTVFVKNELAIRSLVRIRGYVKQDIPIELILEDAQGQKQTIGRKTVRADEDGQQVAVEFLHTPLEAGHYRLTVSAGQQAGELVAKNNELGAYLTVLEGGLRVLYLDGAARHEQRFLRRALNASPDIELDDRVITRRSQKQWPISLGADLKGDKYDAFILGDLDARALSADDLKALADAVAAGKGLLMIGGRSSFGPGHYLETPLAGALPIVIDRLEGADFGGQERDEFYLEGPLLIVPAELHALTRLAADEANAAAWRKLPPLAWANKFVGVKEVAGVRVLLETPQGAPLLVSGEFGQGRVLAFAGESTYLWTMHGFEKEHKRFWRQVILWLVRRDDLNKDDVWIKLDQRRFNPGGRVNVTAGARTSTGEPITGAALTTAVILPDGTRQPLRLALDKDHWAGSFVVKEPGDYAVETSAVSGGKELGKAKAEFLVFDRDVELSNPAADPDLMASLAAWTKQDGGRTVAPDELPRLLAEIARRGPEYETRQIKWKLASTALDAWSYLLALVGALSVEWWLRKKWGLV